MGPQSLLVIQSTQTEGQVEGSVRDPVPRTKVEKSLRTPDSNLQPPPAPTYAYTTEDGETQAEHGYVGLQRKQKPSESLDAYDVGMLMSQLIWPT